MAGKILLTCGADQSPVARQLAGGLYRSEHGKGYVASRPAHGPGHCPGCPSLVSLGGSVHAFCCSSQAGRKHGASYGRGPGDWRRQWSGGDGRGRPGRDLRYSTRITQCRGAHASRDGRARLTPGLAQVASGEELRAKLGSPDVVIVDMRLGKDWKASSEGHILSFVMFTDPGLPLPAMLEALRQAHAMS